MKNEKITNNGIYNGYLFFPFHSSLLIFKNDSYELFINVGGHYTLKCYLGG